MSDFDLDRPANRPAPPSLNSLSINPFRENHLELIFFKRYLNSTDAVRRQFISTVVDQRDRTAFCSSLISFSYEASHEKSRSSIYAGRAAGGDRHHWYSHCLVIA